MVSMDNLRDPPDHLHVREVKKWYVKLLMKTLKEKAEDLEELPAPLLVVCSATKDVFKAESKSHIHIPSGRRCEVFHCNMPDKRSRRSQQGSVLCMVRAVHRA